MDLCVMLEQGAQYNGLVHAKQLEIDRLKREVKNKDERIAMLQRALDAPKYPMCIADDREDALEKIFVQNKFAGDSRVTGNLF